MEEQIAAYNKLFMLYSNIVTAIMVLPVITSLIQRQYKAKPLRLFFHYLLCEFSITLFMQGFVWATANYTDFFLPSLKMFKIQNTNFISILAYLNHFILLGIFYSYVFKNKITSNTIKFVSLLLVVASLIDYFFITGFREYSFFQATASAIFCFSLPLIHLWYVFKTDSDLSILKNTYFWFDVGLLIPNVIGLFLHFTGSKLYVTDVVLYFKLSIVKYYFVMLSQVLICIGFYYARYTKYLPEKW